MEGKTTNQPNTLIASHEKHLFRQPPFLPSSLSTEPLSRSTAFPQRAPPCHRRCHWFIRHGENSGHARRTLVAHSVVLSVWQAVHESGILTDCAVAGAM